LDTNQFLRLSQRDKVNLIERHLAIKRFSGFRTSHLDEPYTRVTRAGRYRDHVVTVFLLTFAG
jgi:hypothetical protein